ncbi:EF-hand calcium-binding domain-containing protein 6-like [Pomacea canaliculata]|nr:EF-hand calcium-binding domain-containing protein 6-like [Pomacea canaliculata]
MASIVSPGVGQSPPLPRLPSCHVTVARRSTAHFVDFTELAASTWRPPGLRREHTIAGYPPDTDRTEVSANTPDIGVATGVPARMLHFPPKFLRNSAKAKYRKTKNTTKMSSCITDGELVDLVAKRLSRSFLGIRTMFRSFDETGGESVNQDALLKILYNTVGYITPEQFNGFLKSLGIENKATISFDLFVSRFKDKEDIDQQWKSPVWRAVQAEAHHYAHPEEELRCVPITELKKYTTAPHAATLLHNAVKRGDVDLRSLLPDACFLPNGVVLKPQLREALCQIGVALDDKQFTFLWDRYDKDKTGAIPTKRLYSILDLKLDGDPWDRTLPVGTQDHYRQSTPYYKTTKQGKVHASPAAVPSALDDGVRGEAIKTPSSPSKSPTHQVLEKDTAAALEKEEDKEVEDSPTADAAKRSQIREVMQHDSSQPKFDSIIDCLFYKFETRYQSMLMAFKLFDLSHDGQVMRVDFRRVLAEFGFPLTAVGLMDVLNKLPVPVHHGMIDYRMLLKKLMTLTDNFVSRTLDATIKSLVNGSDADPDDGLWVRLVKFLHSEYINFAACLLRADKNMKYALSVQEVKLAIERCLVCSMTDKQLEDLLAKVPLDEQGNIKYIEFLEMFEREPGTWNQVTKCGVTVPKQRVTNTPPTELANLRRSQSSVVPARTMIRKDRDPGQLKEELRTFFDKHLFDFDEKYKQLDRKSHNRFSRWQFGSILKLCGFEITDSELSKLWLTLNLSNDGMSTYNGVIMEFAPSHTPFNLHVKKEAEGEEKRYEADEESPRSSPGGTCEPQVPEPQENVGNTEAPCQSHMTPLFCKLQPFVSSNWECVRSAFRKQDPHGYGTVSFEQMQRLIDSLHSGLSPAERNAICDQFDFRKRGRCNYLSFMKAFSTPYVPHSRLTFSVDTCKLEKKTHLARIPTISKPSDAQKPITVSEALLLIRNKLIKHWKNLRRAFQHNDRSHTGYLSVTDFKRVLKECNIPVSQEDLYHIVSEFDEDMDGKISYVEFLDGLLRV